MIKLIGLKKTFKGKIILDGLNYSFTESGLFIINGDNMAGKTTLLYILSFLDTDYQGQYLFNGDEVKSMNHQQRKENIDKTAIIFSHGNLLPHMTVKENAFLGVSKSGYEIKGIQDLDRMPFTLSGGEEIMLLLQREECSSHSILFLDEITSPLSDKNFHIIMNQIIELSKNKLIILNSHDERTNVYNKQLLLKEGKLYD